MRNREIEKPHTERKRDKYARTRRIVNKEWQPEKDFNLIIFERTIISCEYGNGLNRVSCWKNSH